MSQEIGVKVTEKQGASTSTVPKAPAGQHKASDGPSRLTTKTTEQRPGHTKNPSTGEYSSSEGGKEVLQRKEWGHRGKPPDIHTDLNPPPRCMHETDVREEILPCEAIVKMVDGLGSKASPV
ncbi:unnamed protein product [Linum trigynum]|uniref:Uncharacterized protein n=1 Tax=Linum trigynum TaxID=586398 RepID=A0AAV2DB67_9ROSI